MLTGPADVVHAAHPLLIPARGAAQVVTIHDLFFLSRPSQTRAEIRRDYPRLAASHAQAADAVITSTEHGRTLVHRELGVPLERVYVCFPGAPRWRVLGQAPNRPNDGYILFVGTLEARKNIGKLLDAYAILLGRRGTVPPLLLVGRATADASEWLSRIQKPPLAGHVKHLGYVPDEDRERVYAGARVLTLPSLDEGFGLTALEAMAGGIPVVVSNRGSLPEVVGDAGILVDPHDSEEIAQAIERALVDEGWAHAKAEAGLVQARVHTWTEAANVLRTAYSDAVNRRRNRS
jgi:glycosyltransferase involved in cell wall biosynthesis